MRLLPVLALLLLLSTATLAQSRAFSLTGGIPTPVPGTDITLLLTSVQDTRCPPDVSCVWEGAYVAEVSVLSGSNTTRFTLSNALDQGLATTTLGDHTLSLITLTPNRDTLAALGRAVQISDYTLELAISP